jgi:hypothetical protein
LSSVFSLQIVSITRTARLKVRAFFVSLFQYIKNPVLIRVLYILLFFNSLTFLRGQTTLTNGQVFDYSVGDTIEYKITYDYCGATPPLNYQWVIKQKTISANQIDYTLKFTQQDNCNECLGTSWNKSYTKYLTIANADSLANFTEAYSHTPCLTNSTYTDSAFSDANGKMTNYRLFQPNHIGSCYPQSASAYLTEGVGESYILSVNQNGDPCGYQKYINYYHKVGEDPVGTHFKFTVGVPIVSPPYTEVIIFPNPTSGGNFTVANPKKDALDVRIISLMGQELFAISSREKLIEVKTQLPPAVYIITVHSAFSENLIRKIIVK